MKLIEHNGFTLVGNLPDDANDFYIGLGEDGYYLRYRSLAVRGCEMYLKNIGTFKFSIVGLAKDLVGKSDYGELLIYLVENDYSLNTTLILQKQPQ